MTEKIDREEAVAAVLKAIEDDPAAVIEAVAKVAPRSLIEAAIDAVPTREAAPSKRGAKKKVPGPFRSFNTQARKLMRVLPDYVPEEDLRDSAERAIALSEALADTVRAWLKGSNVVAEVEEFLDSLN